MNLYKKDEIREEGDENCQKVVLNSIRTSTFTVLPTGELGNTLS